MVDFDLALKETETESPSREIVGNDLEAAKFNLLCYRANVESMKGEATALVVEDPTGEGRGAEMTAQVKRLKKMIEQKQGDIIKEASEFVRSVQGFTLPFRKDLEAIEAEIKSKLSAYAYKKEMKRREDEAAARKAIEEAQKKINAQAKKAHIEPVQLPTPVVPQQSAPVRTESGTTSYISQWAYEVEDVSKIPARYLIADPTNKAAVNESIRAGIREIPGLRIFEKMVPRTRS
jgi:hypothetical protein